MDQLPTSILISEDLRYAERHSLRSKTKYLPLKLAHSHRLASADHDSDRNGVVGSVTHPGSTPDSEHAAWYRMTAQERLRALYFSDVVPHGAVFLEPAVTRRWAHEFAASAPSVAGDPVGTIRIPDGPIADSEDAQAGIYPYDPRRITTPIFAVFANYDVYANDANTAPFLARFTSSPLKWQLCIHGGTHVIHLERNRMSLYECVLGFIRVAENIGIRGPSS